MARLKGKANTLVDPANQKLFLEMRDMWEGLRSRAETASGKRRQYEGEAKKAGFTVAMFKDSLRLATPEGEAEFKAEIANRLLAAAYSSADIGDQLSLFLDHNRTPLVDRAFREGQKCAMENKAAVPKYDPSTEAYSAFMEGYHDEQGRQVKAGIKKLETKPEKGGKGGKKGQEAAAAPKKRGRPAGSGKGAKAAPAARGKAKDDAPPRKPRAEPVTRASLARARQASEMDDSAEPEGSYFSKSTPAAGNA
jgi:hypothetical protein